MGEGVSVSLEEELYEELLTIYDRTGRATGYWPSYFLRSVRSEGGLATAKKLLGSSSVSAGFDRLISAQRADLSIEAIATSDRYSSLFTPAELAEARRRLAKIPPDAWPKPSQGPFPEQAELEGAYEEGAVREVLVNAYERNQKAREACIRHHGTRCLVCDMDFEERYGEIGLGFIHVHHLRPMAGAGAKRTVDPRKDLVPVCPNCHAMLHRRTPPLDVEDLKRQIARGNESGR